MNHEPTPLPPAVPQNIEAETAVLGSILIDPVILATLRDGLRAEHFYLQKHRWIYQCCLDVAARSDPLDLITVSTELGQRQQLDPVGGVLYLSQLMSSVPSAINAPAYTRILIDTWKRRQMLDLVTDVARLAYNDQEALTAASYLQQKLGALLTDTAPAVYQDFSSLAATLPPIRWLWPKWLPRGMITLLGAVPGAGKSMVALDFARRIIHNQPWPNGDPQTNLPTRNVIYIDAEMVPQLLKERAESWQMDMSKLYLMLPNPNDMLDFSRPEYQQKLRNMTQTLKPALIVIDSLSSVNARGENNIEDLRGILGFFNELAAANQVSLLLIHHLRKRGNGGQMQLPVELSIDDFRGSSHIIAMARTVMALSVIQTDSTPNRNGPRKLEVLKSNLAGYPEALGCEFLPLHPQGVLLQWSGEAPEPYKEPSKQDGCARWLEIVLREAGAEGKRPKELEQLGEYEGYSRTLIYRARKELDGHVTDTEGRQSPKNCWKWVEKP
jgi:KaiC/GvpD/RAD55 family RecA-like ATPase